MVESAGSPLLDPAYLKGIEDYSLLARVVVDGAMSGIHRSLRQGRGNEFFQYRPYERGEDMKMVDWKVFARRDELVSKTFQEDTNFTVYLVVDASASMGYRGKRVSCSKLRYAKMLAACFAYLAHRQGDRFGFFAYSDEVRQWIRPRSGSGHLNRLLVSLGSLEAKGQNDHEQAWGQVYKFVAGPIDGRVHLRLPGSRGYFERTFALWRLSSHYECLCLQVLDPDEWTCLMPRQSASRKWKGIGRSPVHLPQYGKNTAAT